MRIVARSNRSGVSSGYGIARIAAPKPALVNSMTRMGVSSRTASDNVLSSPEIRNPLLNSINFYLPYGSKILNQWIRYYDRFDPLVGNCIDLHGSFPISKFVLKFDQDDPEVHKVYDHCVDEMRLFERILEMSREYELIGEVYPYLHWNDDFNFWDSASLLNPDFIQVKTHNLALGAPPIIELEPDDMLKALVNSTEPEDMEMKEALDPVVVSAVLMGQNIKVDNFNIEQIARKASPYEPRGTSIVMRCLKTLLYADKLREAQMAISDSMITPKIIYKLGDPVNGYMPSQEDILDFRTLLMAQAHDPLAAIITHYGLSLEYIGATGKILPLLPEFQWCESQILTALYTNRSLTTGEGVTYANATVAMEALQGRYLAKRERIEDWVARKVFTPIAIANNFYKPLTQAQLNDHVRPSNSDRELNIPTLDWKQKLRLVEDMAKKQMIINLRAKPIPEASLKTIYDLLDINADDEKKALLEEGEIYKQLKEIYGANSPMVPGGSPGTSPSAPKTPAPPANSNPPDPNKGVPQVKTEVPNIKAPAGSGGTGGSVDKEDAASKVVSSCDSEYQQAFSQERDKALAALSAPSEFYHEDGRLKTPAELEAEHKAS